MSKCQVVSKGKLDSYECPNPIDTSGKCYLHAIRRQDLNDTETNFFKEQCSRIIYQDHPEIVFENVLFPRNLKLVIEDAVSKNIIFENCKFSGEVVITKVDKCDYLIFDKACRFERPVTIRQCEILTNLRFIDSQLHQLKIENIRGNFLFSMTANSINSLIFKDTALISGAVIIIRESANTLNFENIEFLDESLIDVKYISNTCSFKNTKFLRRTDIKTSHNAGYPGNAVFEGCVLDNLNCRGLDYKNQNVHVIQPRLKQKSKKIVKNFMGFHKKNLRYSQLAGTKFDDAGFKSFLHFLRMSKDYFREYSEYVDLYNLYYRLEQYYVRFSLDQELQNRIINNLYRYFSNYGYSIWRPILWLLGILMAFNLIYLCYDYSMGCHWGRNWVSAFLTTGIHHLSQLSLYRSPDSWFPPDHIKRALLILETVLIIPVLSSIIIGIRKVFRRA